jgi:hypothetical protein
MIDSYLFILNNYYFTIIFITQIILHNFLYLPSFTIMVIREKNTLIQLSPNMISNTI